MIRRPLAVLCLFSSLCLAACDSGAAPTATAIPVAPTSPPAPATNTTAPAAPATNTPVAAPPTATTPPPAGALTDAGILAALQAAGLPIAETVVYTADTDPNHLLGRPHQYLAKANWHDTRLPAPKNPAAPEVSDGGGLEIYADAGGAAARGAYIAGIGKSMAALAEYDYLYGPILLRLSKDLTPAQAAAYTTALTTLTGGPPGTPVVP